MKKLITMFTMCLLAFTINAQTVMSHGKSYTVKNNKIFQNGKEVTATLNEADRTDVLAKATSISSRIDAETLAKNKAKQAEKAKKKGEKALKKAEKARKKAEKTLKKKQKAQDKLIKASKKLRDAEAKYKRYKDKGKLSPNDEAKWLKKIEGIKKDITKAQNQLERS